MKIRSILALAAGLLAAIAAHAKVVEKNVDYAYNGMTMKGYLAYDDAKSVINWGRTPIKLIRRPAAHSCN